MFLQSNIIGQSRIWVPQTTTNGLVSVSMPLQTQNVIRATETSSIYNQQLGNKLSEFDALRAMHQRELEQFLQGNGTRSPNTYRSRGVNMAWKYEKADIEMGGKGSANWSKSQRQEIMERGRVKGAEGHHLRNVAHHPEDQSDPNNIGFFKTKKEHCEKGHGGDFHNESDSPMKDKNQMIKNTNTKRLIGNELRGAGISAIISFAAAFSISLIVAAAQDGITPESIKNAALNGSNGAIIGVAGYAVGRAVANLITPALLKALEKVGIKVTESISSACTMGITGFAVIAVVSVIQFIHLKRKGYTTKNAFVLVGKTAGMSIFSLAITVTVCAIWGSGPAFYVGLAIGLVVIAYSAAKLFIEKNTASKVQELISKLLYNKTIVKTA